RLSKSHRQSSSNRANDHLTYSISYVRRRGEFSALQFNLIFNAEPLSPFVNYGSTPRTFSMGGRIMQLLRSPNSMGTIMPPLRISKWFCQSIFDSDLDPSYTSQDCSRCGHRNQITLATRIYRRSQCGLVMHRDRNGAKGIE